MVARTPEGLRLLLQVVQRHCHLLKMKLSVTKSRVMSYLRDTWEVVEGEEVVGVLDKVIQFRYLGLETVLSPYKTAKAMQKRALDLANKYKGVCMRVARDGPDVVDVAMATWVNIARPSLIYGCDFVPFSDTAITELDRCQSAVAKQALGLKMNDPNIAGEVILGMKTVREVIMTLQLKFYVRLMQQDKSRWSHDALQAHLMQNWRSPYMDHISKLKDELGMLVSPVSSRQVDIVVSAHYLAVLNKKIIAYDFPALAMVKNRSMAPHVDESLESQASAWRICDARIGSKVSNDIQLTQAKPSVALQIPRSLVHLQLS